MVNFVLNGSEVSVSDSHPHLLAARREELDWSSGSAGSPGQRSGAPEGVNSAAGVSLDRHPRCGADAKIGAPLSVDIEHGSAGQQHSHG